MNKMNDRTSRGSGNSNSSNQTSSTSEELVEENLVSEESETNPSVTESNSQSDVIVDGAHVMYDPLTDDTPPLDSWKVWISENVPTFYTHKSQDDAYVANLKESGEELKDGVVGLVGGIKNVVSAIGNVFQRNWGDAATDVGSGLKSFTHGVDRLFTGIGDLFTSAHRAGQVKTGGDKYTTSDGINSRGSLWSFNKSKKRITHY